MFEMIQREYPQSEYVLPCKLKIAQTYDNMEQTGKAKGLYIALNTEYPNTPEGEAARQRLKVLELPY